ncbi:MAG: outer membrane lipoprotein chaperone LolA [Candidatus Tectomicrobia bacterium]|nr:outer membrane lipoprotein chaperone LolA [Candidatus Tectomicrobia bacterium]
MQARYQGTESLRADFRQEAYNKALGRTRTAVGRVVIVKPGKMRWEYAQPDKRLIISDGTTLWLYFPASNQVMIEAAAGQDDFVRAFLSGEGRLRQDFDLEKVEDSSQTQADEYGLQLRPKVPHTTVTRMLLFVDRQGLLVKRVTTFDILGNTTTLFLSNLEVNGDVEAGTFTFQPLAGVEIITSPAAPRPGR